MEPERADRRTWIEYLDQDLTRADTRSHFLWTFLLVLFAGVIFLLNRLEKISTLDAIGATAVGVLSYTLANPLVRRVVGVVSPPTPRRRGTDQEIRVLTGFLGRFGPAQQNRFLVFGQVILYLFAGAALWHVNEKIEAVPFGIQLVLYLMLVVSAAVGTASAGSSKLAGRVFSFVMFTTAKSKPQEMAHLGVSDETLKMLEARKLPLGKGAFAQDPNLTKIAPIMWAGNRFFTWLGFARDVVIIGILTFSFENVASSVWLALAVGSLCVCLHVVNHLTHDSHRARLEQFRVALFLGDIQIESAPAVYSVVQALRAGELNTKQDLFDVLDELVEDGVTIDGWRKQSVG